MERQFSKFVTASLEPRYIKSKIPEDWKVVRLNDIVKTHNSGIFKNKEFYGEGENIVGVSDLYNHTKIDGQIFRRVQLTKEEKKGHILEEGDLIYGESSLVRTGIGKSLVVTKNGAGTIFAWHTRRFKINSVSSPSFIYYMLDSEKIRNSIISRSTTTALTGITTVDYFKTKIPFPKKEEQQKIASILLNIDSLLNHTQKEIEQIQKVKKSLIQNIMIRGIGHTKFKKVTLGLRFMEITIPESWNLSLVSDFIYDIKGGSPLTPNDFTENGFPVLHKGDIKPNDVLDIGKTNPFCDPKFAEDHTSSIIDNSFLVVTLRDLVPSGPTIGLIAHSNGDYLLAQGAYGFHFDKKKIDSKYLVQLSNTEFYRKYMKSIFVGSTQIHIRTPEFLKVKLPLPPLVEQQKISSIISNIDSQIQKQQECKSKLEKLKKGLMQKLLTGQIRVKI